MNYYKLNLLLFICLSIFACDDGEVEIDYTPPPPPPVVATGLMDGEDWEAIKSSSIQIDNLFNFGLDQKVENCPAQYLSFRNIPLAIGTYPIQSTNNMAQSGVDEVYSFLFFACGDAIEGDYRAEGSAFSQMTITSIQDKMVKGNFQVKYLLNDPDSNPNNVPLQFEFTDIEFEFTID